MACLYFHTRKFIIVRTVRCDMDLFRLSSFMCILMVAVMLPVTAENSGDYANQTINAEFVVKLPSDWSNFAMSSYAGPATGVMDNNDITNVIAIHIYQNTNCSTIIEENLKVNLEQFNSKAGIANLTEPVYGVDNVTEFGKYADGKVSNLFIRLIDGNVVAVTGTYDTIEDAEGKEEQFIKIAESVIPLHSPEIDVCATEEKTPTPVPTTTYKPRPVPTPAYNST